MNRDITVWHIRNGVVRQGEIMVYRAMCGKTPEFASGREQWVFPWEVVRWLGRIEGKGKFCEACLHSEDYALFLLRELDRE